MKHQYFGDRRDLFKYDLLLDVLSAIPTLERLTFVPMLTPDDDSRQGNQIAVLPGDRNPALAEFLNDCRQEKRRDLRALREFMQEARVVYEPYRDNDFFNHSNRAEYFASIPASSLTKALVFLDPDIGLEPSSLRQLRRGGPEKYLLYSEVAELVRRADPSCTVIVYQHLQRNKLRIAGDIMEKALKLAKTVSAMSIGYVTDDDVVFYGLGTTQGVHDALIREFERHGKKHNLAAGRITA
jgi:hypothetical protein